MKSITALILTIAIMAQLSGRYILMLNYEFNKNYIARVLCVDRNKPKSGCNGKCYLKKQLAKASKEENTPFSNIRVDKNELLFFTGIKRITIDFLPLVNNRQYGACKQPFTPQIRYSAVFHPPQAKECFQG